MRRAAGLGLAAVLAGGLAQAAPEGACAYPELPELPADGAGRQAFEAAAAAYFTRAEAYLNCQQALRARVRAAFERRLEAELRRLRTELEADLRADLALIELDARAVERDISLIIRALDRLD